jgi:hypothetical protein
MSMKSRWVGQAIAKFTADAVAHALHGGPTVDGLLSERLVYRLFRKSKFSTLGSSERLSISLAVVSIKAALSSASERFQRLRDRSWRRRRPFPDRGQRLRPGP